MVNKMNIIFTPEFVEYYLMRYRTFTEDDIDEILLYIEDGVYEVIETDEVFTIIIEDKYNFDISKGSPMPEPEPKEEDEEDIDYLPFDNNEIIEDDEEVENEDKEPEVRFEDRLIKRK